METTPLTGAGRRDPRRMALPLMTVILTVAALKLSAPVMVPLACAAFLIALFWPLYHSLAARVPTWLAALATLLTFLVVVGLFSAALWYAGDEVIRKVPEYRKQVEQNLNELQQWASQRGLPMPSPQRLLEPLREAAGRIVDVSYVFVGGFVIVTTLLVLGLLEVKDFGRKAVAGRERLPPRWREVLDRVAIDFQRYIVIRTLVGLATGLFVAGGCWAIGLDLPFVWGLANFVLTYIPTIGAIVGLVAPAIFAYGQFQSLSQALLALAVVGGVQIVMGNYVAPIVQGRYLNLSPVVVLVSVIFWGWVWGIAGAFMSVPLTILVVLLTAQFDETRWVARLLSAPNSLDEEQPPGSDLEG